MSTQREKRYTTEPITPTMAMVLTAAGSPDYQGKPVARTMSDIGERIITDAGYNFNYKAAGGYMPTAAENLRAQVKMTAVKKLVEQAIADGTIIEMTNDEARLIGGRRYATQGRTRLYLSAAQYERMVQRDLRAKRNAERATLRKEAQEAILLKYLDEVDSVYTSACARARIRARDEAVDEV